MNHKKYVSLVLCILVLIAALFPQNTALAAGDQTFTLHRSDLDIKEIVLQPQTIVLNGIPDSAAYTYLWLTLEDVSGNEVYDEILSRDGNGQAVFSGIRLPFGRYQISLYRGAERYESYLSVLPDGIWIEWDGICGTFMHSPVYALNTAIQERTDEAALAYYLKPSRDIQSSDEQICSLAKEITAPYLTDYEKTLAIHDWVCNNIYYNFDAYYHRTEYGDSSALGVLNSRKSVCDGYANLTAALLRAAGIPAKKVSGYALGLSTDGTFPQEIMNGTGQSNHAWNMAFADGRWIIIDTTWDSGNAWEHGQITNRKGCYRHQYFDISEELFAMDHAVLKNASYREIQLYINYTKYWDGTDWHSLGSAAPVLVNDRAVIPVMEVIRGMGGTAVLDTKRDPGWTTVICTLGNDTIYMWVGRQTYFINGKEHTFQTAPKMVNGCVMVPSKELLLAMNCTVAWDSYADGWNGRIIIGYTV